MSNTESVDEGLLYLKQDQHPLDQAEMLQKALQERCEIYISNQLYRIRRRAIFHFRSVFVLKMIWSIWNWMPAVLRWMNWLTS